MEESLKQAAMENEQGMFFYKEKYYSPAVAYFQKAADKGLGMALYNLALCYEQGHGVLQNDTKAVELYRAAAAKGIAQAQCTLGLRHAIGNGVPKDYKLALECYQYAAAQNNVEALCNLGTYYHEEQKTDIALQYFEAAAKKECGPALYFLGTYWEGKKDLLKRENIISEVLDSNISPQ